MSNNKYVLVLEDNTSDVMITRYLLEQNGYLPVAANDGFAALELLDQYPFVLMIVDLQMPMMSGLEFLRRARSHSQAHNIPMLVVSAKNETRDVKKSIESGASDYIIKPIDPAIFATKIEMLTSKNPAEWFEYQIETGSDESEITVELDSKLNSVSEFSFSLVSSVPLNIGETHMIQAALFKKITTDQIYGRVVTCTQVPKGYLITFSYIGISEKLRKEIRLLCRNLWVQKEKVA